MYVFLTPSLHRVLQVPLDYEPPKLVRCFRLPRFVRVLRHRLYLYLEEPRSSKTALALNAFLMLCNILSTVTYCLESIPTESGDEGVWYIWELCLMIVFTLELLCRAPAHTTMRGFVFRRPAVFVDFLACIPFDFYLFFGLHWSVLDTRWLRPVRLLRIVSLGDHIFQLRLILTGIRRSLWMIALVWSLVLLVLFSFASVLFMAERGAWDSSQRCYLSSAGRCSDYESVPTSLYFSLEVVSSLGYGDIVPLSAIGHLITMLLMLVSVSIIALTVTVFSIQFERVHGKTKRDIFVKTLRESADLRLRMAIFENNDVTLQLTSEATCRLVTAIEILQAIARDLSETAKAVRGDLMLMSQHGTTTRNPHLDKKGFAAISELAIAQLAAVAYNDIDTLTEFILTTSQDLFVQIAGSFDAGQYMLAPYDSPR